MASPIAIALVRFQAITGISDAGKDAAPRLRSALPAESDPTNQAVIVETLGTLKDAVSLPLFIEILGDPGGQETVRMAALVALGQFRDPQSLRRGFRSSTKKRCLRRWSRERCRTWLAWGFFLPTISDRSSRIRAPEIRASALLSLNVKKPLPVDLRQSVLDHITDPSETVRQAAILAVVPLQLHAAVPRLLELAARPGSPDYATAVEALCGLRDPRARRVYLAALEDGNPRLRKLAESALLAIRDKVHARARRRRAIRAVSAPAALSLDRVLASFTPITNWRVIGPFPRNDPAARHRASFDRLSRSSTPAPEAGPSPGPTAAPTPVPAASTWTISTRPERADPGDSIRAGVGRPRCASRTRK